MAGYIGGKVPVVTSGTERKQHYNITTTTTSLTGLQYTPTKVHVFHNGVRLVDGTDYTATTGTSITLTNAAENGDDVVVISYASFQTSDTVSAANGGTFAGNVTMSGDLTVSTNLKADTIVNQSGDNDSGLDLSTNDVVAVKTANTERMRIDADGRVTMPYQPAFRVNATFSHSLGSGWETVGYDTNLTQRGNGYNTSTSIFTAPVAGWYHFSAALTFTGNTDTDGTFAISINGSFSDLINSVSEPSTSGFTYNGHSVSGSAYLAANDNVKVVRYSTVTTVNRSGQEYGGWFSGYLIG